MRIGIIAERTGVSRDTVRLYENMGLLVNINRPNKYNNYKDYPEENILRVEFILKLKQLGLTLKECKQVINTIETEEYNAAFQHSFLTSKIKEIDNKIKELKQLKKTLTTFLNDGCNNTSIINQVKSKTT
ncbi:MerR family transcriptional regulator [Prolixibacteraceae bacterium JC049]|nr:MerR family transcriptional regulator [Prolixibacteraceae bacterium JC049]